MGTVPGQARACSSLRSQVLPAARPFSPGRRSPSGSHCWYPAPSCFSCFTVCLQEVFTSSVRMTASPVWELSARYGYMLLCGAQQPKPLGELRGSRTRPTPWKAHSGNNPQPAAMLSLGDPQLVAVAAWGACSLHHSSASRPRGTALCPGQCSGAP